MALSRNSKLTISNVAFIVMLGIAFKFYSDSLSQPRNGSKVTYFIVFGICLFMLAAVVIIARAYYGNMHTDLVDQSALGADVSAQGLLGAEKLKKIEFQLPISPREYNELSTNGKLILAPGRFNVPIRNGDTVDACTGPGSHQSCIRTKITDIDGYNQEVTLTRSS